MKSTDQNFDDRNKTFKNNIYGTSKGKIREQVLLRDLNNWLDSPNQQRSIQILDVGGGQGQIALELARMGHQVTLTDISNEMLQEAQKTKENEGLTSINIRQASLQDLAEESQQYDLVLCHAVFEWLSEPEIAFKQLCSLVTKGGTVSFMFYNAIGQKLSNLVYGNFDYIKAGLKAKKVVKLNPQSALHPDTVYKWCDDNDYQIIDKSGVRCFHDYVRDITKWQTDFDGILEMELAVCKEMPYADIGRYVHLMLSKSKETK